MTRFHDLFRMTSRPPITDPFAPDRRGEEFPHVVGATRIRLWTPSDPVPEVGQWLLIGVATWNGYDMALLDLVEDALSSSNPPPVRVGVFDVDRCKNPEEFEQYIPGTRDAMQSPIVGWWVDGRLRKSAWGGAGCELAIRVCGLDLELAMHHVITVLERP